MTLSILPHYGPFVDFLAEVDGRSFAFRCIRAETLWRAHFDGWMTPTMFGVGPTPEAAIKHALLRAGFLKEKRATPKPISLEDLDL